MNHEKTFLAIDKLRDVEVELHRLKNALEMANAVLDAKRDWQGLTDEEIKQIELSLRQYNSRDTYDLSLKDFARAIEAKLREKNV